MTRRYCDRCKKEIFRYGWAQATFPTVVMTVLDTLQFVPGEKPGRAVDLCPDCQKKVYDFVFGEESKETDHDPQD